MLRALVVSCVALPCLLGEAIAVHAAPRGETWLTLGPGWGALWLDTRVRGTLQEPGRFASFSTHGKYAGSGFNAVLEVGRNYWFNDGTTALGPLVALRYGQGQGMAVQLRKADAATRDATERLEKRLSGRAHHATFQGGVNLATLSGALHWRLLLGGGRVASYVEELRGRETDEHWILALSLGGVLRLPAKTPWAGVLGVHCGYSKYVLEPGGATACMSNVGVNWLMFE